MNNIDMHLFLYVDIYRANMFCGTTYITVNVYISELLNVFIVIKKFENE